MKRKLLCKRIPEKEILFCSCQHFILLHLADRIVFHFYIFYSFAVISKPAMPAEFEHTKNSFFYNAFIHFGNTKSSVLENNRNFFYFKSQFPHCKFHFNLKCVTYKNNFVKI